MMIEHTFITTKEQEEVRCLTQSLMQGIGLPISVSDDHIIDTQKGLKHARKAKTTDDLPHLINIAFDRGRIELAISVADHSVLKKHLKDYVMAIVNSIEAMLKYDMDVDSCITRIKDHENEMDKKLAKKSRNNKIAIILFIVFIILLIVTVSSSLNSI